MEVNRLRECLMNIWYLIWVYNFPIGFGLFLIEHEVSAKYEIWEFWKKVSQGHLWYLTSWNLQNLLYDWYTQLILPQNIYVSQVHICPLTHLLLQQLLPQPTTLIMAHKTKHTKLQVKLLSLISTLHPLLLYYTTLYKVVVVQNLSPLSYIYFILSSNY